MLGADTRSTAGTTVADKNCEKIHYIGARWLAAGRGMMRKHSASRTHRLSGLDGCPVAGAAAVHYCSRQQGWALPSIMCGSHKQGSLPAA